jgi:hypothetical protein
MLRIIRGNSAAPEEHGRSHPEQKNKVAVDMLSCFIWKHLMLSALSERIQKD